MALLHTLVGRIIDPLEAAIVSVTQVHAGDTWNVIPERALLRGTVRSFKETVQDALKAAIPAVLPRRSLPRIAAPDVATTGGTRRR